MTRAVFQAILIQPPITAHTNFVGGFRLSRDRRRSRRSFLTAGPVKTGCVVLVRSASFLVLAGRVEVGVGVKGSGEARPRSGRRGIDGDAVRRMLFRAERSKSLVAAFGWCTMSKPKECR